MEHDLKYVVTKSCANYVNGKCVLSDRECPIISGGEYRGKRIPASDCSCAYFEKAVLPASKTAEAIYYGKEIVLNKSCKGCRGKFHSVSNRALYCSDICKKAARKKTHVKYNQKRI